jgi:hypothetical protein
MDSLPIAKVIIIRNRKKFKLRGPVGKFHDKLEEVTLFRIISIEIKSDSKDSERNQGSEQVFSPLSEVSIAL